MRTKHDILSSIWALETMPSTSICRQCLRRTRCSLVTKEGTSECHKYKPGDPFIPAPIKVLIESFGQWIHDGECGCWMSDRTCSRCAIVDICRELDDYMRVARGLVRIAECE